jgi:inhibitor of KinA sporulation pathway (predicted exonuclease)
MSLDLELNKPSGKIIQVGVAIGDLITQEILHTYSTYINVEEILDPFIINLTGIKQSDVDNGTTLFQVYDELKAIHKAYECFRNPLTWGGGDTQELKKQLCITDDEMFLFGRRWIDVKTIFLTYQIANNQSKQAGLAKALVKMGLQFKGKKHNAVDDAINTFYMYVELLKRFKQKEE